MEILYVIIHLAIISKGFSLNFGSLIQTLPPEFPEDFRRKILDMYWKHPEDFGDTPSKGKSHVKSTKINRIHRIPKPLRMDEKASEKSVIPQTTTAALSTPALLPDAIKMPPMQIPPMPIPIPIPYPMYPQMPIVLPMRTYFEPVIHHHPPLDQIRQIIKEDEDMWAKNKAIKKEKIQQQHPGGQSDSDSSDTDSDDYNRFDRWEYYDDFLHIKG